MLGARDENAKVGESARVAFWAHRLANQPVGIVDFRSVSLAGMASCTGLGGFVTHVMSHDSNPRRESGHSVQSSICSLSPQVSSQVLCV